MVVTMVRICMMWFWRMPDLRLEHILDLGAILPQQLGLLPQADDSILEHLEQQRLLLGEEAVVVLAQLTGHVVQLGVVAEPSGGFLPQGGPWGR